MSQRFRILSLDGGGIRGAFTASFLSQVEQRSGRRIIEHFDMITGTSTGGLLALALAMGHPAERIVQFYREEGPRIFPSSWLIRAGRWCRHWVAAKHNANVLAATVQRLLGATTKLGDAQVRLAIPAYDVVKGKPVVFKTGHHDELYVDVDRAAWEVGMATASAPIYFKPFRSSWGGVYVDGGIWANRPSVVGIIEAQRFCGVTPEQIEVLNVGTTHAGFSLQKTLLTGKLPWVARHGLVEMLMSASAGSAGFQAKLLAPRERCVEIDTPLGQAIPMDDSRFVPELIGLGDQAAKEHGAVVMQRFMTDRRGVQYVDVHTQPAVA